MRLPQLIETRKFYQNRILMMMQQSMQDNGILLQNAYATTACNPNTGNMVIQYAPAAANYGPIACLQAHEQAHANVGATCCQRYNSCLNRDDVSTETCHDVWNRSFDMLENRDECQAYAVELNCLNAQLNAGGLTAAQRATVNARIGEAQQEITNRNCANIPSRIGCPFSESGLPAGVR